MQTVIIVVHLIIVLALIGVVLLQRSEGGLGLGGGGGSGGVSGFMTGRGQTNALTRATAILAAVFFVTSLALAWIATRNRAPSSILDTAAPTAPAGQQTPTQGGQGPGVLEQLQRMQGGQGGAAPGPSTPAPSTAPDAPLPTGPVVPQSR